MKFYLKYYFIYLIKSNFIKTFTILILIKITSTFFEFEKKISKNILKKNNLISMYLNQNIQNIFKKKFDIKNFLYKTAKDINNDLMIDNNLFYIDFLEIYSNQNISFENKKNSDWKKKIFKITLEDYFISSAKKAGLTYNEIFTATQIMQSRINFKKLRQGDQFIILMFRKLNESSYLSAIKIRRNNKNYYVFRAQNGNFYDNQGFPIFEKLIQLPVKNYRISSNFNLKRLNPITKKITPHRGVDFALPDGTPVFVVKDGKVIVAKEDYFGAGNHISIKHKNNYVTRYMHLKKLLVRTGQKVKKGDCIALSGNTGRSTGPHLHYEIWVNNQAINPLKSNFSFSKTKVLTGKSREIFFKLIKNIISQLE